MVAPSWYGWPFPTKKSSSGTPFLFEVVKNLSRSRTSLCCLHQVLKKSPAESVSLPSECPSDHWSKAVLEKIPPILKSLLMRSLWYELRDLYQDGSQLHCPSGKPKKPWGASCITLYVASGTCPLAKCLHHCRCSHLKHWLHPQYSKEIYIKLMKQYKKHLIIIAPSFFPHSLIEISPLSFLLRAALLQQSSASPRVLPRPAPTEPRRPSRAGSTPRLGNAQQRIINGWWNLWEKFMENDKSKQISDLRRCWMSVIHVFQWCQVVKSNPIKVPLETWRNIENPDSLVFFDGWQFVWRWKEQRICQTPAETDLKQEATWSCHVMFQKSCFKKCVSKKYTSDRENLVFGCSSHHSLGGS